MLIKSSKSTSFCERFVPAAAVPTPTSFRKLWRMTNTSESAWKRNFGQSIDSTTHQLCSWYIWDRFTDLVMSYSDTKAAKSLASWKTLTTKLSRTSPNLELACNSVVSYWEKTSSYNWHWIVQRKSEWSIKNGQR